MKKEVVSDDNVYNSSRQSQTQITFQIMKLSKGFVKDSRNNEKVRKEQLLVKWVVGKVRGGSKTR